MLFIVANNKVVDYEPLFMGKCPEQIGEHKELTVNYHSLPSTSTNTISYPIICLNTIKHHPTNYHPKISYLAIQEYVIYFVIFI